MSALSEPFPPDQYIPLDVFHRYFEEVFAYGGASALITVPRHLSEDDFFGKDSTIAKLTNNEAFSHVEYSDALDVLFTRDHLSTIYTLKKRSYAIYAFENKEFVFKECSSPAYRHYLRLIGAYLGYAPGKYPNSSGLDQYQDFNWGSFATTVYNQLKKL